MAAFGIKAIQPQDNEHIFGFASARGTADDSLLEVWNGPTNSDLKFTIDKAGQLQGANGTAARPTYSFEADKDSGRYMSGAGTFLDVIAGTAVGTWTAGKLTLTELAVDNININLNTISSTAGTDLNITPLSGEQIVLDGTIVIDAGVVTGATSITSTAFVGALTGAVTGTASVATVSTTSTVTEDASTNENNAVIFASGGDPGAGASNLSLESDGGALHYNPSTETLTAPAFAGALTGAVTGTASVATVANTVVVVDSTDTTSFVAMFDSATGSLAIKTDGGLLYNAGTGMLTATGLTGPLTGLASTSTLASTVVVVDSTDTSSYIAMFDSATGSLAIKTDGGLTYNAGTGMLTATGLTGPLTGLASTASVATVANTVVVVDSTDTSSYIAMFSSTTGSLAVKTDGGLTYNAGTGMLTATGLTGPLTGLASTATLAATVTVADESSDTTCFPAFFTAATGSLAAKTDTSRLTYNAGTGAFASTLLAGALTGTVGAASATTGAFTTIAASGNVTMSADASVGDDLSLVSDAAVLNFGGDSEINLTHVHDTGLLLNSTSRIQFHDASQYIGASSNADLDIAATTDINLNCTTVDVNAALTVSGTSVLTGNVTISGDLTVDGTTTTINSTTISVDDKNIELGSVASPSDSTADGGGITLKGASDKTILWENDTDSWDFNQHVSLKADAAVLAWGADRDVTLTHVADTGLLLNSTRQLQFNDASQYISGASATKMIIAATDEVEINTTAVDLNGTLDVSGTLTLAGNADFNGDLDVDGTTNLDVVDIDGAVDMASTLAVTGTSTFGAGVLMQKEASVVLTLANTTNGVSGTPSLLQFNLGASNGSEYAAGYLGAKAEGTWTGTSSTRDSALVFQPVLNGSEVLALTLGSDLSATFTGAITGSRQLLIDGTADEIQFLVQGHSTQNESLVVFENSSGTNKLEFTNAGNLTLNSGTFQMANNVAIKMKESGGTVRDILSLSGSNVIMIGNDSLATKITADLTIAGDLGMTGGIVQTNGAADADIANSLTNSATNLLYGISDSSANRFVGSANNYAFWGTSTAHGLEFATNNTVRFAIDSAGAATFAGTILTATGNSIGISGGPRWTPTSSGAYMNLEGAKLMVNETANGNMDTGLTINQGASDNQIFCLKSSDVSHGLTTATIQQDVEVDDFYTLHKYNGPTGGISVQAINEHSVGFAMVTEAFSGSPDTSDATNSGAVIAWFVAEHDGSNGLVDMAANSNGYLWGEITSGGTRTARMILKADDGELHLGNTTLVAVDEKDDISLVRAMQYEASNGVGMRPKPWNTSDYGVPAFSHEKLMEVGVLGEKDEDGNCLMRVQPRFAMNEGAIWQNHVRHMELVNCLRTLVEANPNLEGRDTALALLETN